MFNIIFWRYYHHLAEDRAMPIRRSTSATRGKKSSKALGGSLIARAILARPSRKSYQPGSARQRGRAGFGNPAHEP